MTLVDDLRASLVGYFSTSYVEALESSPPGASILAAAFASFSALFLRVNRAAQAGYIWPHSTQTDDAATSGRPTTLEVELQRTSLGHLPLVLEAGTMSFEVLGVTYTLARRVVWEPTSSLSTSGWGTFTSDEDSFRSAFDGFDAFPIDLARVITPSGRTARNGTLDVGKTLATLTDTGSVPVLLPQDVGSLVVIEEADDPTMVGLVLPIIAWNKPGSEAPVGSGLFPRSVTLALGRRDLPAEVLVYDASGGTYTDITASAIADADAALLPAVPAMGDALVVVGRSGLWSLEVLGLDLDASSGVRIEVEWQVWDGASWIALEVSDGTASLRVSGRVTWAEEMLGSYTSPVSGITWPAAVRAVVVNVIAAGDAPQASRVAVDATPSPSPVSTGGVAWRVLGASDYGLTFIDATVVERGSDDSLWILGDERGHRQTDGESDDAFRARISDHRPTCTPNAIQDIVDVVLSAAGGRGRAVDVSYLPFKADAVVPTGGFDGLFLDTDALDLYSDASHSTVRVVSTVAETLSGLPTVDGVALTGGDRILLTAQAPATDNGVWFVDGAVWSRDPAWGWADGGSAYAFGWATRVTEGDLHGATTWVCTSDPDEVGVDALAFEVLAAAIPINGSEWKLLLDLADARGFMVIVPFLRLPMYGLTLDGSAIWFTEAGVLGDAADAGFLDGGTVDADAFYRSVFSAVEAARAFGFPFTVLQSTKL